MTGRILFFPAWDAPSVEVIDFFLSSKKVRRVRNKKRARKLEKRGEMVRYYYQIDAWLWVREVEFNSWFTRCKGYAKGEYGWTLSDLDKDDYRWKYEKGMSPVDAVEDHFNEQAGAYLRRDREDEA